MTLRVDAATHESQVYVDDVLVAEYRPPCGAAGWGWEAASRRRPKDEEVPDHRTAV